MKRHGADAALLLWEQICDRQRYTNTLEYFIQREGDVEKGTQVWKRVNSQKNSINRIKSLAKETKLLSTNPQT